VHVKAARPEPAPVALVVTAVVVDAAPVVDDPAPQSEPGFADGLSPAAA
jgi:hypothetical protein